MKTESKYQRTSSINDTKRSTVPEIDTDRLLQEISIEKDVIEQTQGKNLKDINKIELTL